MKATRLPIDWQASEAANCFCICSILIEASSKIEHVSVLIRHYNTQQLTCCIAMGPVFVKLGLTKLPSDAKIVLANADSISSSAKLSISLCRRPSFDSRVLLSCSSI